MSKFKLIEGQKLQNKSNIRFLQAEIEKRGLSNLTQKEYFVFAYHFAINGDTLGARRFLKRLKTHYFLYDIYKDLYKALLAWAMKDIIWNENMMKEHQFFIVVKNAIPVFREFDFPAKPEFMAFARELHKDTTVIE